MLNMMDILLLDSEYNDLLRIVFAMEICTSSLHLPFELLFIFFLLLPTSEEEYPAVGEYAHVRSR